MRIFKIKNTTAIGAILLINCISAISQEKALEDYIQNIPGSNLTIEMVAIPRGEFRMGSPESEKGRFEDEGPSHAVEIDAFWMSKFEITWDLYKLFLNRAIDEKGEAEARNVKLDIDAVSGATIPYVDMSLGMGTGKDLPVANVTRLAASKFCEWLSAKTGHFYRLPTEAEWEYAARAGTETAYHFGDDPLDLLGYGWYYENSDGSYQKIGQKKPNPWGLYDMYGNVAEWTLDQYSPDTYKERLEKTANPYNIPSEDYPHSVRGGSYDDDPENLRSAARLGSTENWKMRDPQFPKSLWWHTDAPFVGFRIVRVENPPNENNYENYWGPETP